MMIQQSAGYDTNKENRVCSGKRYYGVNKEYQLWGTIQYTVALRIT